MRRRWDLPSLSTLAEELGASPSNPHDRLTAGRSRTMISDDDVYARYADLYEDDDEDEDDQSSQHRRGP
ncbi:hypothetical protein STENM327S_01639 [Streptomyces tendae]